MRGLREPDPRPVHPAGLPGPGVARRVPEMRGVQPVPGRVVHVLRAGRENLLQTGLHQVGRVDARGLELPPCVDRGLYCHREVLEKSTLTVGIRHTFEFRKNEKSSGSVLREALMRQRAGNPKSQYEFIYLLIKLSHQLSH